MRIKKEPATLKVKRVLRLGGLAAVQSSKL